MEIDKEKSEEAVRRGTFFGFIPHCLEIPGRPELSHYPFNVMFMSWTIKDGKRVSGTALYKPGFDTYRKDGDVSRMRYHSIYGGDGHLVITYDEKNKRYCGEKFVNGKSVGSGYGGDWKQFFIHLTMLGLAHGEQCEFKEMPSNESPKAVQEEKPFGFHA